MTGILDWLQQIDAAQTRLLVTARKVTDDQVRRPSLLPGWSVGHVLTHLARNADSLVNLATWARTGVRTPQYASTEARDADIEAGAGRSAAELAKDVADSNERLGEALGRLEPAHLDVVVEWRGGALKPAGVIPSARLTEVEVHHADLGLEYGFGDIPEDFRVRLLTDALSGIEGLVVYADDLDLTVPAGGEATVTGSSGDLLGWASGRTSGERLKSAGRLPDVPEWR
jgi:maleylpyruvate isomerase